MVSVREIHFAADNFDMVRWSMRYCQNPQQAQALCDAFRMIPLEGHKPTDENVLMYAREMVECLSPLSMDLETLQAAVLFIYYDHGLVTKAQIEAKFGTPLVALVSSIQQLDDMRNLNRSSTVLQHDQVDNMRRMLLSMVEDVRAVVIKLAVQVCALRHAKHQDEETRVLLARDVSMVYAPLANRLGIGQLKWELEDLAFHYLHPKVYKEIAHLLDGKRIDREQYINNFVEALSNALAMRQVRAEVYGRPKHIASIWKKMQRKNLSFDDLYDVRAVRILTEDIQDCYATLGVIHTMFKPIPGEFDDYIAHAKPNGYQSIHTVVVGAEGKTVEIQIRTQSMHQDAELGIAAHWKYKELDQKTPQKNSGYEDKINWLRKILQWQDDLSESGALVDEIRAQVFEDRVYVFTPKGAVINLPLGATVLDFAYYIHSHVGHTANGAKVDGRIVPFHYQIKTGERIEILTSKEENPKRDWLNSNLGYVNTQRARLKISSWFRHQAKDKNLSAGKELLEQELKRLGYSIKDVGDLYERFNVKSLDDFLIAIGGGTVRLNQVLSQLQGRFKRQQLEDALPKTCQFEVAKPNTSHQIEVNGVGNLLTQLGGCCHPLPGDVIVGYITMGRGVTVHRHDCDQLNDLMVRSPERVVDVAWGEKYAGGYTLSVHMLSADRSGLLSDITTTLANEKSNVLKMTSTSNVQQQTAKIELDLEIYNLDALSRLLNKLNRISGVIEVHRC
jgi:GTP pyrophosphokinase